MLFSKGMILSGILQTVKMLDRTSPDEINAVLAECLLESETKGENVFHCDGKAYDRDKFIRLATAVFSSLTEDGMDRELERCRQNRQRDDERAELYDAMITAYYGALAQLPHY